VTGVMGGLATDVGAPVRDHAQQALADADTVELSDGHAARVRMAAQKPPEEVATSFTPRWRNETVARDSSHVHRSMCCVRPILS
jgi:hypothetical protein